MPQRECFILTTSAWARKQQHCIVWALYVTFPLIWPSHLSPCNCFLLLVWWWSRLHKDCLTGKIWMNSQCLKGNLCEMAGNNFFFPPDFFSKPSKPFVSLLSTLLVPGSHYSSRMTNHSNKEASQHLRSPQLNIHRCLVKSFTRFSVELSSVAGKDILFIYSSVLLNLLQCSLQQVTAAKHVSQARNLSYLCYNT